MRIWCKAERTKDCLRLLPVRSLMTNSQESLTTGYSPHELFMGRLVGKWVKEQQDKVDKAKAMLGRVRERQWKKKKKH